MATCSSLRSGAHTGFQGGDLIVFEPLGHRQDYRNPVSHVRFGMKLLSFKMMPKIKTALYPTFFNLVVPARVGRDSEGVIIPGILHLNLSLFSQIV
jgi:hypothetical protein